MERIAILSARRTAIGTFGGVFQNVSAVDLGIAALKAAIADAGAAPSQIDEVVTGNVLSSNLGQNVSRQIAVGAGLPVGVPAYSVNKLCGSGLKAVCLAAGAISLGEAEVVAAGGTENMSRAPYVLPDERFGARLGNREAVDLVLRDGLWDAFENYHMGETAEILADEWEISRREMDEFAVESQARAQRALAAGRFTEEIAPVAIPQRRGEPVEVRTDEHPRAGVTLEGISGMKPAFRPDGRVTAANSSGINDGASYLIVARESVAESLGIEPLGYIAAYASAGVEPSRMGFGPVPATEKALARSGWKVGDIELVELNEAFAAQSLAVLKGFSKSIGALDPEIINVNGGAIALGHPIGASGARILTTLLHEMRKRELHRGLATMCIGGGQGIAILVER
ncbi:MAG TPA: acetyl-CoA C-acetyltransferase [Spirochaetia bacterium]|nr:acetyl-CoA C-acetyltransferase [Spirochaetia bacterium]